MGCGGDGEERVENAGSTGSRLESLVDQDTTNRDMHWLAKFQSNGPIDYIVSSWNFLTDDLFDSYPK